MAPRIVNKKTYYLWTTLFYSLCLSGLIWQAWQISDNFFKFEVVKDINVFTPEESSNEDKVVYVCFNERGIWNITAVRLMRLRYEVYYDWPLKERLEITYKRKETFSSLYGVKIIDELIRVPHYCYQFQLPLYLINARLNLDRKMLKGYVADFEIAIGRKGSPFDQKRLVRGEIKWKNVTQMFHIKSNSFDITKLKSPYTDHCHDYTSDGFMDMNDAKAECYSNSTHLSPWKVVLKSKYNSSNATLRRTGFNRCRKSKFEVDCNVKLYLTQVSETIFNQIGDPAIKFLEDTDASFSIISKAKVDGIEYLTYILGAMGTWLGFSFVGINPIPYFIRKRENSTADINQQTNQSDVKRELIRMNQKSNQQFTLLGQKLDKSNQTIKELKQSNDELKQSNIELKQSNTELKQKMNGMLHYIEQR